MKNHNGTDSDYHETVLAKEVAHALHIKKNGKYIDATLGNAGHTIEIIKKGGRVLGIDMDPKMLEISKKRIERELAPEWCKDTYKLVQGNFVDIDKIAKENDWEDPDGILFDLGVTNLHLKDAQRGFSFENPDATLDMRINPEVQGVKGSDLLNVLREDQLRELFEITLDPGAAKWITGRVLHSREAKPIESVGDLLEISRGLRTGKYGINEATLPFLAVRIAVNSELANLEEVLPKAFNLLKKGGRLAVISFHSKEDALVKNFFKEMSGLGAVQITYKPITADTAEIEENRRARSAKLRILEK